MDRDSQQLGDAIRAARVARGMSMNQLARAAGIEASTVMRWETAQRKPGAEMFAPLARALEIDVEEFYALAGLTTPEQLPSLPVYLRTKYNLTPEKSARFEALLREVEGDDSPTSPEGTRRNGDHT